ncbi:MAG: Gfo/Idh/MocA family protein [Candidatus Sumerlaeia bacterium]
MAKTIKVGILGTGFMGGVHAQNLNKIKGVQVTAVCGTSMEKAEKFADEKGKRYTKPYGRFKTMLQEAELDALVVAIPPFAHSGQVEAAAKKGLHLFMEKPLALDVKRAKRMANAIKRAGVIGQVAYHMRFGKAVQELKKAIESGKAGKPTLFDARYACNSLHGPWWRDVEKSGGQTLEQIIHIYDLALYFLGAPKAVAGFADNLCHTHIPDYTVEDTSAFAIRFKGGAMANISGTNNAVPMEWVNPFTVVCEKLTAFFETPDKAEFVFTGGDIPKREIIDGDTDMYYEEMKAFVKAVQGKIDNPATAEDGLLGLKTAIGALESAASGGELMQVK